MSTIASPRESSVNGRRVIPGGPLISTPTSSTRPSIETSRSADPSPSRLPLQVPKRNRAALREYYNLKAQATLSSETETASTTSSSIHDNSTFSSVPDSELDSVGFNAQEYVRRVLQEQTLGDLLKTYNSVLGEVRALEAEKKALVYDNYSKLIGATETIGRMRDDMAKGGSAGGIVGAAGGNGVLDGAVRGVFDRAEGLRAELRKELGDSGNGEEREKKRKMRGVVERILKTPQRVRGLVRDEKDDEARELWERTVVVLNRWKERGVGGSEVLDCIQDGEMALRGEPPGERSWETREREGNSEDQIN